MGLKKTIPDQEKLYKRQSIIEELFLLEEKQYHNHPIGLEKGNKKTGQHGRFYDKVFVWNIPSVISCPGMSKKCLTYCYNGDIRTEVFPINDWQDNLYWFKNKPDLLKTSLLNKIKNSSSRIAVRIHSSGDFFSHEYIEFWTEIIDLCHNTDFWCYTRSWSIQELLPSLEALKRRSNIQMFASWDETMDAPPFGWRISRVFTSLEDEEQYRLEMKNSILCPEQILKVDNCANCGFCIRLNKKNINFILH